MKNILLFLLVLPNFCFSQNTVDSVYIFDVGDEFHYKIVDKDNGNTKFEKRIVISKTQYGAVYQYKFQYDGKISYDIAPTQSSYSFIRTTSYPGLPYSISDSVSPCNNVNQPYYLSVYSNPTNGIFKCLHTDSIEQDLEFGKTYKRSYYYNDTLSREQWFSSGLGKTYLEEKNSSSMNTYTNTEKMVYYKKSVSGKTWGIPYNFASSIEELESLNFTIFPNPASNYLFINRINENKSEYSLSNSLGSIVLQGTLKGNKINCSVLKNGIYLLKLTDNEGKFGIQRVFISK